MLVPNPNSTSKAQIGNRDFDLVSELSERQSIGSFDISSSSDEDMDREAEDFLTDRTPGQDDGEEEEADEEDEEEDDTEQQQDKEYTIYSMVPRRRPQLNLGGDKGLLGGHRSD